MFDHGFHLTLQAMRRQLAAMPCDLYLIRLIHHQTRRAFPGERLWTATPLTHPATVRFLRVRNREGCDVYLQPYAEEYNPGYILVDLDHAPPGILETMRSQGMPPCVVLQTSPGHLQAWVHVSTTPLEPSVASALGRQLARLYHGDLASTDWRHLGRLAGFTNQKPLRRNARGYAPWVRVLYASAGLAPQGTAWCQAAIQVVAASFQRPTAGLERGRPTDAGAPSMSMTGTYADGLRRLSILERFPQPDWSIADKWIAKELLRGGNSPADVATILRAGSPGFPGCHFRPDDYLSRTLARAAWELQTAFPRRDPCPLGNRQRHAPGV
jgi:RepB DNA-primase from phage plasmid